MDFSTLPSEGKGRGSNPLRASVVTGRSVTVCAYPRRKRRAVGSTPTSPTLWPAGVTDSISPYEGDGRGSNPLRAI